MAKTLGLTLCALALSACQSQLSPRAAAIKDADPSAVANCKFLGDVQGLSMLSTSVGVHNARNQALEKAAQLNATHIVWTNITGGLHPSANGRAYLCAQ